MSEVRDLTCVRCPMGCQIQVTLEEGVVTNVTGNGCPRGDEYARNEVVHPMRTVTSTVKVEGGVLPVVPVKTQHDIPKDKIFEVMKEINEAVASAPVQIGDVLKEDLCGTGVALVASGNVDRA